MNRIYKKIIVPLAVVILTTLPACIGDNFEFDKLSTHVQMRSQWEFPIAFGTLTIEDMVDMLDSSMSQYLAPTDTIILRFQDTLLSRNAEDIISLDDKTYTMSFDNNDFSNPKQATKNTLVFEKTEAAFPFDNINAYIIDGIDMQTTNLQIKVNSNITYSGTLTITFEQMTKNDAVIVETVPFTGSPINSSNTSTLSDYYMDYTEGGFPTAVFIRYRLELTSGSDITLGATDRVDIEIGFSENKYGLLKGYIGQFGFEMPASNINLGFLSSVINGNLHVELPRIGFRVTNSFGLPASFGFSYLQAINTRLGRTDSVTGVNYFNSNPILLQVPPVDDYPNIVPTVTNITLFNGSESNFADLIDSMPNSLEYATQFLINPNSSTDIVNYIAFNSRIDVFTTFDFPLWLRSSGIVFVDTTNFDIGQDSSMFEYVKKLELTLDIANGFPHEIRLQGILTDQYGAPLDSLFSSIDEQYIIESGNVVNGRINQATGKTRKVTTIDYSKEKFDKWKFAKFIIIQAQYNTTLPQQGMPQESVIYYRDYGVDVKINAKAEIEVDEHL